MYSEQIQTSNMKYFAETVNAWKPLTIFPKRSILDVWQGSECAFVCDTFFILNMIKIPNIENMLKVFNIKP